MYNTNKSLSIWLLVVSFVVFLFTFFISPAVAVLPFDPDKCGFYAE
ncbi:MAG: hypothetical protein WCW64_11185 [Phycisphaerae bacterium]|jgi:hypothetical protein